MESNFRETKSKFIVDEATYPQDKLTRLMGLMLKFLRVAKDGQVVIIKNVPSRKILQLILSSRFIANKVENNIKEELTKEELLAYSCLKKEVFNTRFSELLKDGFVDKKDNAVKAKNILLVERFLEKLGESEK